MKVLILRTFAHTKVWENIRTHCEFECSQLDDMIYKWEPDYSDFLINDFRFALGIYIDKYFTFRTFPFNTLVNQNTKEEQIISLLKLNSYKSTSKFTNVLDNGTIQVFYTFERKLWNNPNITLMNKIDESLIQEKKNELQKKHNCIPVTKFQYPLSFSLDENSVKRTLEKYDINLNIEKI